MTKDDLLALIEVKGLETFLVDYYAWEQIEGEPDLTEALRSAAVALETINNLLDAP